MAEQKYPCSQEVLDLANSMLKGKPECDMKFHCVLLYETEWNVGIPPERHDVYVRRGEPRFFDSYDKALCYYSNTPNPASQILSADSKEELLAMVKESDRQMNDPEWVKEFLLPCL